MNFELQLLIVLTLAIASAGLLAVMRVAPPRLRAILASGLAAMFAVLALRTYIRADTESLLAAHPDYPIKRPVGGYVSSDQCKACHPREYSTWHSSFHRTMTQRPTEDSVEGIFGVSLT